MQYLSVFVLRGKARSLTVQKHLDQMQGTITTENFKKFCTLLFIFWVTISLHHIKILTQNWSKIDIHDSK